VYVILIVAKVFCYSNYVVSGAEEKNLRSGSLDTNTTR
jgi:hypothetical protein